MHITYLYTRQEYDFKAYGDKKCYPHSSGQNCEYKHCYTERSRRNRQYTELSGFDTGRHGIHTILVLVCYVEKF